MKNITCLISTFAAIGWLISAASALAQPVFLNGPANQMTNSISLEPGWSLIANPYSHNRGTTVVDAVPDNSVKELFKVVPQGMLLFKFDNSTQRFSENRFRGRSWSNPSELLIPGEGAWIFNPSRKPFMMKFTGNCLYAGGVEVPEGWSLISSPDCGTINFAPLIWPPPGGCGGIWYEVHVEGTNTVWIPVRTNSFPCAPFPAWGWDNLAFNPQEGDVVYTFDNQNQGFQSHSFQNGAWDRAPVVGTAEACFVLTTQPRVISYTGPRPF